MGWWMLHMWKPAGAWYQKPVVRLGQGAVSRA